MWGETIEEDLWDPKEEFFNPVKAKAEHMRRKRKEELLKERKTPIEPAKNKPPLSSN